MATLTIRKPREPVQPRRSAVERLGDELDPEIVPSDDA